MRVVAIGVGDDPQQWQQLASVHEGRLASGGEGQLVNVLDADCGAYERLTTEKLPRTYLLDAAGKILWLDIEYSRATRRELENALRHYIRLSG